MKDAEHEHSQDDFAVEITDLPEEVIPSKGPLRRPFGQEGLSGRPALRLTVAISLIVLALYVIW